MISFSVKYLQDPFQPLNVCRDTVLAEIILGSSLFIGTDVSRVPLPCWVAKAQFEIIIVCSHFFFVSVSRSGSPALFMFYHLLCASTVEV